MAEDAKPILEVTGLTAGYGASQVLDGVSFSMGVEAVCIIGRNGMGKTTLCATLMGLVRPTGGAIAFHGVDLAKKQPEAIARAGISYVPQGRRLFPSLTVDEHLRMLAKGTRGKRWTPEAVYELFPRLADRRSNGGAQLSGGEQQMLAVGRALLLNGSLVLMDEPSEGLAPTIVDTLVDAIHRLVAGGRRRLGGRAEPARGHDDRRAPARDGHRPHPGRDHRVRPPRRPRAAEALPGRRPRRRDRAPRRSDALIPPTLLVDRSKCVGDKMKSWGFRLTSRVLPQSHRPESCCASSATSAPSRGPTSRS